MRTLCRVVLAAALVLLSVLSQAQTLAPRAYLVTPVGANAVTVTASSYRGDVLFDDSAPLTDASGTIAFVAPTFYHGFGLFGRSANVTIGLPYVVGSMQALVFDQRQKAYRSGLGDGGIRFATNLVGGPAMQLPEFLKWRQKRVLGASFSVQMPAGQYVPTRLINIGNNRWAFKPDIGYSERHGKWLMDVYAGAWFFTPNSDYISRTSISGTQERRQEPIYVSEAHLSYDFNPLLWASLDGNFWYGGRVRLNGVENPATLQRNSRIGFTAAIPLSLHNSLKFSYDRGAVIRYGGKYQEFAVAWQYHWIGRWAR